MRTEHGCVEMLSGRSYGVELGFPIGESSAKVKVSDMSIERHMEDHHALMTGKRKLERRSCQCGGKSKRVRHGKWFGG